MTSKVSITKHKIEGCRHEGKTRYQFRVSEIAYRDDGSAYPHLIMVVECANNRKTADNLENYLRASYAGRVVSELDTTPLIAQLF